MIKKFGPHNIDIISILFGSLLSDAHGEMRTQNYSVRFFIKKSNKNMEYLMWFHNYLAERGYCNSKKPLINTIIGKHGHKYFSLRFHTFSYSSLLFLYYCFYYEKSPISNDIFASSIEQSEIILKKHETKKRIPSNFYLDQFLTPLALAVWFMNDGSKASGGAKILTNCFIKEDIERIILFLFNKYKICCSLHRQGSQYIIYIPKKSMPLFSKTIKKYMVSSMYYKLANF